MDVLGHIIKSSKDTLGHILVDGNLFHLEERILGGYTTTHFGYISYVVGGGKDTLGQILVGGDLFGGEEIMGIYKDTFWMREVTLWEMAKIP